MIEQENVIIAKGLTKMFGDFIAVNAISCEVKKGEIQDWAQKKWQF